MRVLIFAMVVATAVQGSGLHAQSLLERFDRVDRNRDGKVTAEELPRPELFERLDRNGDGMIDRSEVPRNVGSPAASSRNDSGLEMPPEPVLKAHKALVYAEVDGVDPNLLSLDLYVPDDEGTNRPVMIMIHGGGWRGGDKANPAILGAKMRHFVGAGYIYASINYRLSPATPTEDGLKHPVHAEDCAKAIAWIHDHVGDYGGDPGQLHLMGHSAGGHLAGIVATNERFLAAHGKQLSILRTNVLLDPAAIDIPGYLAASERGMSALYNLAFGQDEANILDASPRQHVEPGKGIPPTLIFYGGERMRLDQLGPAHAQALTKAGSPSQAVDTVSLDHGQINSHVGMIGDPMTELIMRLHAGEDASTFPDTFAERGEPSADPSLGIRFESDYEPGTQDASGEFMGGTESMRIIAHTGKLFAGLSYWTDQPGDDPQPGAQVLVKAGPDSPWMVDQNFPNSGRVSTLETVTFRRDASGRPLKEPVTLLLADASPIASRNGGWLGCYVRDDATGEWIQSTITGEAPRAFIRAFGMHQDEEAGMDLVFAGTGAGEIYSGVYDPAYPGGIRWNPEPEYQNPDFDGGSYRRCQGFCVANNKAYASVAPHLVERTDGVDPVWQPVFSWTPEDRAGAGLRGITAVSAVDGNYEVILGSREQEGRILRIDPTKGYAAELELQSDAFLKELHPDFRGGRLVAYNRLVPGIHPQTGEPIHWLSVAGGLRDQKSVAWLLIRNADATYEVVRVEDVDRGDAVQLVSTRTLEYAPWSDREFYLGGYDGAANQRKNHNTAWIYRGSVPGSL